MSDLKCRPAVWWPSRPPSVPFLPGLILLGSLVGSLPVAAAESAASDGSLFAVFSIVVLGAITLAALIIVSLVLWSRKQENISDMMLFCMKYLVHSEDEAERGASARALGRMKDPGALLVLINLVWDESEKDEVRNAASEALHEMSTRFRKYRKIIENLELKAEQRDFRNIIDILIANFEQGEARHVQSAYIIGRHYMRLENYVDGRDWLTKAEFRNRKTNLYGIRIAQWIRECNAHLLEEADDAYKAGDYQQAREHFAALAHGLSDVDRRRCAVYLRSACVYCKLEDYRNADQAVLQALEHNHATDLALALAPLLQEVTGLAEQEAGTQDRAEEIRNTLDERTNAIADTLLARYKLGRTTEEHEK